MRVEWSQFAQVTFARFMADDQAGLKAVNQAVASLAEDPAPPEAFVRGDEYCRLRVGRYRVMYRLQDDLITIVRVDRVN
jgi:mRNA interferase RelE/StbE